MLLQEISAKFHRISIGEVWASHYWKDDVQDQMRDVPGWRRAECIVESVNGKQ